MDNAFEESDDSDSSYEPSEAGMCVYHAPGDLENLDRRGIACILFGSLVTVIPNAAFAECSRLCHVSFPPNLKTICSLAFACCSSLEQISSLPSSLLTIGRNAFAGCHKLKDVKLNEGLLRIEDEAFLACYELEVLKIPSSVKCIGVRCFKRCLKIKFVEFGPNVDDIGDYAFEECRRMTVARLPPSIHTLNRGTFKHCDFLLSVELPLGLKYLRQDVFQGCEGLRNLAIPSSVDPAGEDPFDDVCTPLVLKMFPTRGGLISSREENVALQYEACVKRFYGYPIHEFCYKQSYLSLADALEGIEVALEAAPPDAVTLVDSQGFTVFHVLALSSKPRINLFQILQARCPRRLMEMEDRISRLPLDYLRDNSSVPSETKKLLLDYLAQMTVLERASKLGLLEWRRTVIKEVQEYLGTRDHNVMYDSLKQFEQRENLSLLELTIWRWKLDDREARTVKVSREQKRPKLDERQVARVNCGADIIIANVVPFLDVCRLGYIDDDLPDQDLLFRQECINNDL